MRAGAILFGIMLIGVVTAGYTSTLLGKERNIKTSTADESSFANFDEAIVEHYDLSLNIDFNQKIFFGRQKLHFRTQQFNIKTIYLDIEDLKIKNITDSSGRQMPFEIENPNPNIGKRLKITIPPKWIIYETFVLTIDYETSVPSKIYPGIYRIYFSIFWIKIFPKIYPGYPGSKLVKNNYQKKIIKLRITLL